jgi:hypothetical protein
MDNTLLSAFSKETAENASILNQNDDMVYVDVEDDIDADFWEDLLKSICPHKEFHFVPYHTYLKEDGDKVFMRGKSHVLHPEEEFNKWHIGCVDSDYDWLLSDKTQDGKTISSSKYLLQTYAYSIESLMCQADTLADFCRDNTEEDSEFDFKDYLNRFSRIVYPLLIWSVYLYDNGNTSFTPTDWRKLLVNTEKDAEASLAIVKSKVQTATKELDTDFEAETAEKDKMEQMLKDEKDVTEANAYLYVRGHDLFDHLLASVLGPIIFGLRGKHYSSLRDADMSSTERKTAFMTYQEKDTSVRELLQKNYRYKASSSLYEKIKHDVTLIWE